MAHAQRFLALVNDAKKRVKESNVADVKRRLDAGEKLVLIDVREESPAPQKVNARPGLWLVDGKR